MIKKFALIITCAISIMTTSCKSDESKAKDVVTEFSQAVETGMNDKFSVLYPDFTIKNARVNQINPSNLKAIRQDDGVWKVEDGNNHIFFVSGENGNYVIKDTKNVVIPEVDKINSRETAAHRLGMVDSESTDMEIIKAYNLLNDGSPLIEFLKHKYPQAQAYGIEVQNIRKKKQGGMGVYWIEAKATLKSGSIEPLGAVDVYFLFKDKDGNVLYKFNSVTILSENDITDVEGMVDLSDHPNVTDVDVEIKPFEHRNIRDIELLSAYAPLSKDDYKEFISQK